MAKHSGTSHAQPFETIELRGRLNPDGSYDAEIWTDGARTPDAELAVVHTNREGIQALWRLAKEKWGRPPRVDPGDIYDCFPLGFFE
jgi:hypothetical protein